MFRHALARDVVWLCFLEPPNRRLPRRLARRLVFDAYGSYNPVWWLSVAFGVASAIINLPIVEEPVDRSGDRGRLSRHHAIRLAESVNSLSVATPHVFR